MSERYLWDRGGPPDPEIRHLEEVLGTLRYGREFRAQPAWRYWAAAAAVLVGVLLWGVRPGPEKTAWVVAGGAPVYSHQVVRTGSGSGMTLEASEVGRLEVGPESTLRVEESGAARQRLRLLRGRIHALIWAPPKQFVMETPSARAVDLGCEYTLAVDEKGDGLLAVESGWVAFAFEKRESFIPAGAMCRTRKGRGPGTPYYADASAELRAAVERFDESGDAAPLRAVLDTARPKDGLTLWHLLTRVAESERGAVYERFAALVALPPDVTRDGVGQLDARMIDLCWDALKLENTEWWRGWEREWRPE